MSSHKSVIRFVPFILIAFFICKNSYSQELEPRNYAVIPKGMNAAALAYTYSSGDIVADATSPIKNLELTSNSVTLGYVRSFGLFGRLCKIQALVPFVFLGGSAKIAGKDSSGTRTGFADSRIRFGINIFGPPAQNPKDFIKSKEDFVMGASLVVSVPTGLYYSEKLINLGSNRWGLKPEIGLSYKYKSFYFEVYSGIWFFSKNSEYLNTKTFEQLPLFSFQSHISYLFPSKIWIALNAGLTEGGETKLDGVFRNDSQNNLRSGVTLSVPISRNHSVKALFNTGVSTRVGGDFTTFTLTYQYSWL
ncbi:MAG: transporter [Bacteroidetes bacterium]|nr:transporter [Bacteroidota bacterium]